MSSDDMSGTHYQVTSSVHLFNNQILSSKVGEAAGSEEFNCFSTILAKVIPTERFH